MSCITTPNPAASEYLATTNRTTTTSSAADHEPNDIDLYSEQTKESRRLVKPIDYKIKTEMSAINLPTGFNLNKTTSAEESEVNDFNRPTTPPASTPSPVQVKNVNKRKIKNQYLAGKSLFLITFTGPDSHIY